KKESTKMDDQLNTSRVEKSFVGQCPLTFDGAFGLTKEKHSLEICSTEKTYGRHLSSHLEQKHKLQKIYADRLCEAAKNDLDVTTKLFHDNEEIIDHGRFIPCPFTSDMISSIGYCVKQSQKTSCTNQSIHKKKDLFHSNNNNETNMTEDILINKLILFRDIYINQPVFIFDYQLVHEQLVDEEFSSEITSDEILRVKKDNKLVH
ncbi:unnamed protein product, partial [Adineta steineri]